MQKWLGWNVQFSYNHIAVPLLQTGAEWFISAGRAEQCTGVPEPSALGFYFCFPYTCIYHLSSYPPTPI